jgi:hypothetical protein
VSLRLASLFSRVFLHLFKHFFLGQTGLAARTAGRVTFVIVMLVIRAVAEIRRVWFVAVHLNILLLAPPMHQARPAHNS